ncbi:MAG: transcriptional repressor [Lachnospiraceae bacterium]
MKGLKYSRQRESIQAFLATRNDHPTANTVYENIREVYPNISLGTVYRNLSLLADIGKINKLTTSEGADRFDARITPHNHFYCRSCHSLTDLEMANIDFIKNIASEHFTGKVETQTTLFMGLCPACLDQENSNNSD